MLKTMVIFVAVANAVGGLSFSGLAQDTNGMGDELKMLRQKIEALEQKVKTLEEDRARLSPPEKTNSDTRFEELNQKVIILERNRELDKEAAEAKAKEAPRITAGSEGLAFGSAKGDFKVQLRGLIQADSRTFFNDAGTVGNDSLLMRRVRPILQGTLYGNVDFLFVPDFAPSGGPQLFDAYLNYRFLPELQLRAGKYKAPVGLEYLQPDQFTLFNERGLPTYLVPGRDVGFELHGDLWNGIASYAAGIFNGVGDGRNSSNVDFEDDKAFVARLFFQPFRNVTNWAQGFGVGVGGSYESFQTPNTQGLPQTTGGTLGGFNTEGQEQFFAFNPTNRATIMADGEHWRISPQFYYFNGPFSLLGEYVISNQRVSAFGTNSFSTRLNNTAWQLAAGWVLTGEDYSYNSGVNPRHPFNPSSGEWGAWQIVARYSQLSVDDAAFPNFADPATSARSADAWSLGMNWYPNRNVTFKTSFTHTTFDGGGGSGTTPPAIVTRKDENVLFTRVQLSF